MSPRSSNDTDPAEDQTRGLKMCPHLCVPFRIQTPSPPAATLCAPRADGDLFPRALGRGGRPGPEGNPPAPPPAPNEDLYPALRPPRPRTPHHLRPSQPGPPPPRAQTSRAPAAPPFHLSSWAPGWHLGWDWTTPARGRGVCSAPAQCASHHLPHHLPGGRITVVGKRQ